MGKVIMSGIVPTLKAPVTGVLASSLAVGSTVKLMEGGTAVEYLVVNQGIPENSNLYDASCDGTWLLRKDIHSNRQWHTSDVNAYASSAINTWLNGDFFNSLGSIEKATIKQVKIPYCFSSVEIISGENGLLTRVFLISFPEVGATKSMNTAFNMDGALLQYFRAISVDPNRIAYENGTAIDWWLRSAYRSNSLFSGICTAGGGVGAYYATTNYGVRPAVILPSNALFDETTMLLKGVA